MSMRERLTRMQENFHGIGGRSTLLAAQIGSLQAQIMAEEGPCAEIEFAEAGYRITIGGVTYLRIGDPDPPYTSNMWVDIETGTITPHWSWLAAKLKEQA